LRNTTDSPSPRGTAPRNALSTLNVGSGVAEILKKTLSKSIVKQGNNIEAPLPPVERVRPALFVMLEKQLQESKETKVKPPTVITVADIVKRVIKICHREDIRIRSLLQESRIQRAIDISNTLFRLANKS
jgi:hypothetical protein